MNNDFAKLFLLELLQKGVREIPYDSLREKLMLYCFDVKYQRLFSDNVDFMKSFTRLEKEGLIFLMDKNCYLLPGDGSLLKSDNEYDEEWKQQMRSLVSAFQEEVDLEKNSVINLKIYRMDPNRGYSLARGHHRDDLIAWTLKTDGLVAINKDPADKLVNNPADFDVYVNLDDGIIQRVAIENATYVYEEGLVNDRRRGARLYTDKEDVAKIIKKV